MTSAGTIALHISLRERTSYPLPFYRYMPELYATNNYCQDICTTAINKENRETELLEERKIAPTCQRRPGLRLARPMPWLMTSGSSFASHISHATRPAPRAAKALADDPDDVGLQRIRLPHLLEECQSQLPLLAILARAELAGHELALLPAAMSCQLWPARARLA